MAEPVVLPAANGTDLRRRELGAFLRSRRERIKPEDLVQLIRIGLEHPELHYEVVYGASDNARSWWDNVVAVFPDWRPAIVEAREAGQHVLVQIRAEGSGTGSGIRLERDTWQIARVEDGRIKAWGFYRSEQEALEAAARN